MVVPSKPNPMKPKGRKVSGSLLALGTAAIVSVYTIGYVRTQSSIDDLASQLPAATPSSSSGAAPPTPPAGSGGSIPRPTATPARPKTSQTYADGSYTGSGTSRHGSITATVVISGGKIVSASVSNCSTRYPCSDVNPLVRAVVSSQSVPASNVSGATDSSNAYKSAVSAALQKALAPA